MNKTSSHATGGDINENQPEDCEMNTLQIKGARQIIKGKMQQRYARLTDDEQQYAGGKKIELTGRILQQSGLGPDDFNSGNSTEGCACGCGENAKERKS